MKRYTDFADQQAILALRKAGCSYAEIARQTRWHYETVRKICRLGVPHGKVRLGRPAKGLLSSFDPRVRFACLKLKRQHPLWGPDGIRAELANRAWAPQVKLPCASQIGAYFSRFGKRLIHPRAHKQLPHSGPMEPSKPQPHSCWQIDVQERVELAGYGLANVLDIIDDYTGLKIGCFLFPGMQGKRRCKVSWAQYRLALRLCFERWGLPDRIRTDRERVLVAEGDYPYPKEFTLWLAGLGIEHELIRRVIENGRVERSHQTRFNRLDGYGPCSTLAEWQTLVNYECWRMNAVLPSRGRGCQRRPPALVYPQAYQPNRCYRRRDEFSLFDLERVKTYLSHGRWLRHTSSKGQFSLNVDKFSVGTRYAQQWVLIKYDALAGFCVSCPPDPSVIAVIPVAGLAVEDITGLPIEV